MKAKGPVKVYYVDRGVATPKEGFREGTDLETYDALVRQSDHESALAESAERVSKAERICKSAQSQRTRFAIRVAELTEALETLRKDSSLWKAGRASGADQYQGLPPAMRLIDEVLNSKALTREGAE